MGRCGEQFVFLVIISALFVFLSNKFRCKFHDCVYRIEQIRKMTMNCNVLWIYVCSEESQQLLLNSLIMTGNFFNLIKIVFNFDLLFSTYGHGCDKTHHKEAEG